MLLYAVYTIKAVNVMHSLYNIIMYYNASNCYYSSAILKCYFYLSMCNATFNNALQLEQLIIHGNH